MVFPKILDEKLGVSSNTSRTVDYIKRILTDCMIYISRFTVTDRPFKKVLPHSVQLHKSLELMNSFTTTADDDSIVCHWQFQFPKTSAAVWMSDDSILDIYCRIYEPQAAYSDIIVVYHFYVFAQVDIWEPCTQSIETGCTFNCTQKRSDNVITIVNERLYVFCHPIFLDHQHICIEIAVIFHL